MGHGFDLAEIRPVGRLDQGFPVTGGDRIGDVCAFRDPREEFPKHFPGSFQGFPFVVFIEGIQQPAVLIDQGRLGGGGAGVDAQV